MYVFPIHNSKNINAKMLRTLCSKFKSAVENVTGIQTQPRTHYIKKHEGDCKEITYHQIHTGDLPHLESKNHFSYHNDSTIVVMDLFNADDIDDETAEPIARVEYRVRPDFEDVRPKIPSPPKPCVLNVLANSNELDFESAQRINEAFNSTFLRGVHKGATVSVLPENDIQPKLPTASYNFFDVFGGSREPAAKPV